MAEDLEQKIKLTYETNADSVGQQVAVLSTDMDGVSTATDKNAQATKNLDAIHKSFKTQLKEANQLLLKQVQIHGETSKEAIAAAKSLADLKDQMQFAKDLTENFNPDQKLKALTAATQIATTATSGLVSGYALFGEQSEDTQKMLLKVQAAMAFSDSISNLSKLGDQWDVFKTTVKDTFNSLLASKKKDIILTEEQTVAQRIQNAVANANPYILLATAIVAITIVTVAWYKSSSDAAEAQKKIGDELADNILKTDALKKSIDEYNASINSGNEIEVLRAKSLRKSDAAVNDLIKSQKKQAVSDASNAQESARKNLLKSQNATAEAFKTGNDDLIKQAGDAQKDAEELWRKTSEAYSAAINDDIKTNLQQQIDSNKKSDDALKAHLEKVKAAREKAKQEAEARAKQQYDIEQGWLKLQNDQEKAFLDASEAAKKEYSDRLKTDQQKQIDDENDKYQKLLDAAQKFNQDTEDITLEHLNVINDINLKAQQDKYDQEKAIDDAKLAYKQELQDAEINLAEKAAGFLTVIAGKNKVLQKAAILAESGVGIAKMIIANNAANVGALATPQAIATDGAAAAPVIAFNNITTALSVAASVVATTKALAALGGGSAGSFGNNKSASPGGSSGSAAPQVTFQGSSENQIANGVSGKINELPPVKAFVVAGDITTAQQVEANKISSNSI